MAATATSATGGDQPIGTATATAANDASRSSAVNHRSDDFQEEEEEQEPDSSACSSSVNPANANDNADDTTSTPEDERTKHWKASKWAVGRVDPTWGDTVKSWRRRRRQRRDGTTTDPRSSRQKEFEGYLCFGAAICAALGAKRVGNMAVLRGNVGSDAETEEELHLGCLCGPYWPVNVFLVWPFVIALTLAVAILGIPKVHVGIIIAWAVLTLSLILSMMCVSFRDPGILRRHPTQPEDEARDWLYNDQALTYRPMGSRYDPECAVVIDGFDHTCPWTGTAIGRGNMCAFRCFVGLIFATLMFDVVLLVGLLRY